MNKDVFPIGNIPIKEVSKLMGKSEQFIRQGIIEGYLPIGIAYKKKGSSKYSFYVSPKKLYEVTGYLYQTPGNELLS